MSYPSASTPDPSVHQAPSSSLAKAPFTPGEIEAYGEAFLDGFLAQVAFALGNVSILGVKPFAFLTAWGQDLQQQAEQALGVATGAQTTATGAQSTATSAQSTANSAQAQSTSNFNLISWILGLLGIGTSGGTATTPATPPGMTLAQFINALTTNTDIAPGQLRALAPKPSKNVLSDPTFDTSSFINGQQDWCWDGWIGTGAFSGINSSVRTVRRGLITIYNIVGTTQGVFMFGGEPINTGGDGQILEYLRDPDYHFLVDWALTGTDQSRYEWINVPYPAAEYPMGGSVLAGYQWLVNRIQATSGPFIFVMDSQGNQVGAAVYDELRFGSLKAHRSRLIAAIGLGNLRREQGHTFPGYPDPAPGTSGMCTVSLMTTGPYAGSGNPSNPKIGNLVDTEDLWWDMCVPGDYYACCPLNGSTVVPPANAIGGNVGDIAGIPGLSLRQFYAFINQAYTGNNTILSDIISWGARYGLGGLIGILEDYLGAVMQQITNLGSISSPHNSYFTAKPFAAKGDNRTFIQVALDYINSFAHLVSPPGIGMQHQLLGQRVPAAAGDVITAGAQVMWTNVVCSGPAIVVAVNAYDAGPNDPNANLIATVVYEGAVISDPEPSSNWNWVPLQADFVMPEGTQSACLLFDVYPQAMTTGIVWFDQPIFEVTNLVDGELLNQTTLKQITGQQVSGPQGIADLATFVQNQMDGWVSANAQNQLNSQTLEQALQSQAVMAAQAILSYNLGVSNNRILSNVSSQPLSNSMQPSGQSTFPLPSGGTLPTISIAAGTSLIGFINSNQNVTIGFLEFEAKATGASNVYINTYSVDPAAATFTNLYTSPDVSALIPSSSYGWAAVNVASANQFYVEISEIVALEIANNGSVAISVVADTSGHANNPNWPLPNVGASRTLSSTGGASPASLTASQVGFGGTRPYVCMAVSDIPPKYEPPNQVPFTSPGMSPYPIPTWAQTSGSLFDLVACGAGGAAGWADGNFCSFLGIPYGTLNLGQAGAPGVWSAKTLTYGTDIPNGTTALTTIIGNGGCAPSGSGGKTLVGYDFTHVPQFDSVSAGAHGNGTSLTWTHTAAAGAYVLVGLNTTWGTFDVKYGTTTMVPLGLIYLNNTGGVAALALYGIEDAPGGTSTITVTVDQAAYFTGGSISFTNVSCAGVVNNTYGHGTALTQAATCGTNQIVVQAFANQGYGQLSAFTGGTKRYYDYVPNGKYYSVGLSLSYATAPTTFAATSSVADSWGGMAVVLNPAGTVLLSAGGGQAGGPGGSANYNPANHNLGSTPDIGAGPGNQTWQGRLYVGGATTTGDAFPGNAPGGGASGGTQATNPTGPNFAGGTGAVYITARQAGTGTNSLGGGFGSGGSELSVIYEATGGGAETATAGVNSISWTHTTGGGPNCAVVLIGAVDYSSGAALPTASFGSSTMVRNLGSVTYYNSGGFAVGLFALGIIGPPSGTQTVSLSASGATINDLAGVTISYQNVGDFGQWFSNNGSNTTPNLDSLAAATGDMVVCGFAAINQIIGSFSGTQRWAQNVTASVPMVVGDAVGASAVSFGASMASSNNWGAIGGLLLPSS